MDEILPMAARWVRTGRPFAIATVVGVAGSAPRPVGSSMIVDRDGAVFGNVSGGCVEAAVHASCLDAIASGAASVERFGYADAEGIAVGLTCGGSVEVLVRPVLPGSSAAADLVALAERDAQAVPTAYTLTVAGPSLGAGRIGDATSADAGAAGAVGIAETAGEAAAAEADGGRRAAAGRDTVTIWVGAPARLVIVGAVEFAVALSRLGLAMGMRVEVVDPREVFASAERFPGARVIVDWPDRYLQREPADTRTAVCVLSHDPKLDVPALRVALASAAGYVGAMGSRRTHDERRARLVAAGVAEASLARLRSPIGLDLGGRGAAETALSILAEIVADRHSGSGIRLSERAGAIHAEATEASGAPRPRTPGSLECTWPPDPGAQPGDELWPDAGVSLREGGREGGFPRPPSRRRPRNAEPGARSAAGFQPVAGGSEAPSAAEPAAPAEPAALRGPGAVT
ncbi:MAG: XdhC family protein [Microbacterium sp.]